MPILRFECGIGINWVDHPPKLLKTTMCTFLASGAAAQMHSLWGVTYCHHAQQSRVSCHGPLYTWLHQLLLLVSCHAPALPGEGGRGGRGEEGEEGEEGEGGGRRRRGGKRRGRRGRREEGEEGGGGGERRGRRQGRGGQGRGRREEGGEEGGGGGRREEGGGRREEGGGRMICHSSLILSGEGVVHCIQLWQNLH